MRGQRAQGVPAFQQPCAEGVAQAAEGVQAVVVAGQSGDHGEAVQEPFPGGGGAPAEVLGGHPGEVVDGPSARASTRASPVMSQPAQASARSPGTSRR